MYKNLLKDNYCKMKVYFNNSCKICRSEINLYKKEKIEEIDWIDITNNEQAEIETNKEMEINLCLTFNIAFLRL